MLKKILNLLLCVIVIGQVAKAQVTTSSITGFVKGENGNPLEGATFTAIHQPTGAKYVTISKKKRKNKKQNEKKSRPKTNSVDFVGFTSQKLDNIVLA